jgi:hypothetical protein
LGIANHGSRLFEACSILLLTKANILDHCNVPAKSRNTSDGTGGTMLQLGYYVLSRA